MSAFDFPATPRVAPRYGGCACSCHSSPHVKHVAACCGPTIEEEPMSYYAYRYPSGSFITDDAIELELLGRWQMFVPSETSATGPGAGDKWFLDWALHAPAQVGAHLRQGQAALRVLKDSGVSPRTIHHPFGGLGGQALVAQNLWPNAVQTLDEFSPDAARHLRRYFPGAPGRPDKVRQGDSYKAALPRAAVYVADYGDCTAHRMADTKNPRRLLFERMVAEEPDAILLTDIAGPRLHMPKLHASYERATGMTFPINDYPSYLRAYASWLRQTFGYLTTHIFWQRWSSILVLRPDGGQANETQLVPLDDLPPVPGGGSGFRVLS